eukprot:SM000059S18655  [mRNA]  locus=s59:175679:176221:- [translate_table: standard]
MDSSAGGMAGLALPPSAPALTDALLRPALGMAGWPAARGVACPAWGPNNNFEMVVPGHLREAPRPPRGQLQWLASLPLEPLLADDPDVAGWRADGGENFHGDGGILQPGVLAAAVGRPLSAAEWWAAPSAGSKEVLVEVVPGGSLQIEEVPFVGDSALLREAPRLGGQQPAVPSRACFSL